MRCNNLTPNGVVRINMASTGIKRTENEIDGSDWKKNSIKQNQTGPKDENSNDVKQYRANIKCNSTK